MAPTMCFNHVRKEMLGDDSLRSSLRRELLRPQHTGYACRKRGWYLSATMYHKTAIPRCRLLQQRTERKQSGVQIRGDIL